MEETGMARVTKDTTIGEVIQIDAGVIPILMGAGMHCVGCPSSAGETLEEAAMVHGIDSERLLNIKKISHCSNICNQFITGDWCYYNGVFFILVYIGIIIRIIKLYADNQKCAYGNVNSTSGCIRG